MMKRLYSGNNPTIIEHLNLKYYIFPIHFLAIFNRFHFRVVPNHLFIKKKLSRIKKLGQYKYFFKTYMDKILIKFFKCCTLNLNTRNQCCTNNLIFLNVGLK